MNIPAAAHALVRRGRRIQLAASIMLLVLICGLLAANYQAQRSLYLSKLARLQTDFDDHALVLAHFFNERRNDLREIAASRQVLGYFENRALGMTMAYGLQASLNNITKAFQHRWNSALMLMEQIYVSLVLTDTEGRILTAWPMSPDESVQAIELPQGRASAGDVRESSSPQGEHVFTSPVLLNNTVVGYVQGRVAYATLYRHFLANIPGMLAIGNREQLVFRANSHGPVDDTRFIALAAQGSPKEVRWREVVTSGDGSLDAGTRMILLSRGIGDRPLLLHALIRTTDLAQRGESWIFFGALALFSFLVLAVLGRLVQANVHNLVLANSLDEAEKREQAIADKKGQLEIEVMQRQSAEQELTRQQAMLRSLLDSIPDLIVYKDRQGSYLGCNRAYEEFIGQTEKAIIGKNGFNFFDTGMAASQQFLDRQVLAGGSALQGEEALCATDGQIVLFDTLRTLYHGPDGQVLGLLSISRDITSRRQKDDELRQAKAYAESVIRNFLDTLIVIDRNLRIETINQASCRLLGYQESELLGQPVALLFDEPPGRIQQTFGFFGNETRCDALPQRELRNVELSYRSRDGRTWSMSWNMSLLADENGQITGVIAGAKDISALKRSEAQRTLQAAVIEQTHAAVLINDARGIIRYANRALERISGYTRDDLTGRGLTFFRHTLTPSRVFHEIWRTLRQGQTWQGHFSIRHRDGSVSAQSATVTPIRDQAGVMTDFVVIMHDVSREITLQQQLLQSQKLEAIGQLAAGIAHEINTPIQYVQNNVTFFQQASLDLTRLLQHYDVLLKEAAAALPQSSLLASIECLRNEIDLPFLLREIPAGITESLEGIERVVRIVSAMKEFSHPGTDRKVATDLNRAIENTVTVTRNEWKYVAEMITDLAPDLPLVPCLPDRWNQALLNLVINAAHAIAATGASKERGLGRITISTRQVDDNWIEVRIADTGIGIPEKIRDRIFEPFFTTKEVGKGTGQGLTIVHDVVVGKHGGSIRFESINGQGCTFIILLPLAWNADPEAASSSS